MRFSRETIILIFILAVGALLRGFYLSEFARHPDFAHPSVDAGYHDYWARALVTGRWTPPEPYDDPLIRTTPYFRPPGYPYFLAFAYLLTGGSCLGVRIIQMLLGILSGFLAFRLGRKWLGAPTGLIFAGLMSVYWVFIYFEGELLEPVLLVPLGLLLVHEFGLWTEKITFQRALVTGLILGAFALVRPNVLLFAPAVLAWAFWVASSRKERRRFAVGAAGFILGAALVVAPVTIRNYVIAHDFVPISSNTGINLLIGNNEDADGFCYGQILDFGRFETCYDYPRIVHAVEKKVGRPMKHSEVSAYLSREAVSYMRGHPMDTLSLTVKRALLFWCPLEVGHNKEDELERANSPILRNIPVNFPAILALAVIGLLMSCKRRDGLRAQHEVTILILLFIAAYFVSYLPFFAAGRYRVTIIPFLMFFGAYGLHRLGRLILRRSYGKLALWLLILVGAYGLASINFTGYKPDAAKWRYARGVDFTSAKQPDNAIREYIECLRIDPEHIQARSNLGLLLIDKGKTDEAIREFRQALEINPDDPYAHHGLALALLARGKIDEAAFHFADALRVKPDFAPSCISLGIILESHGRQDEAMDCYSKALEISPNADISYRLGNLLAGRGRLDEAIAEYRKCIRMKPKHALAHFNLGVALERQGKLDEAIEAYSSAVEAQPKYAKAHKNLAVALFFKGDYAAAWEHVKLCRENGGAPHPDFIKALSKEMTEP